ncbi:MAG: DUF4124 domain-containing protein [Rhodanobacteraceae bacterium]
MRERVESGCHRAWYARVCCAGLLLVLAGAAHAQSVYRCTDSRNGLTFQAMPCAAAMRQTVVDIHAQPLIDPNAVTPVLATKRAERDALRHLRTRALHGSRRRSGRSAKQPTSYECRASDGEVFYRHSRCPHSVPGDGIARNGDDGLSARTRSGHGRGRARGAWGAVSVTSCKIPRSEACQRLDAIAAADRDGHARDEQVPVYEHLVGRDPCNGF